MRSMVLTVAMLTAVACFGIAPSYAAVAGRCSPPSVWKKVCVNYGHAGPHKTVCTQYQMQCKRA